MATDMGGFAQAGGPYLVDQFGRPLYRAAESSIFFKRSDLVAAGAETVIFLRGPAYPGTLRIDLTHSGNTRVLFLGTDYTVSVSGTSITLLSAAVAGDIYSVTYAPTLPQNAGAYFSNSIYALIAQDSPTGFWHLSETTGAFIDTGSGAHNLTAGSTGITRGVTSIIPGEPSAAVYGNGSSSAVGGTTAQIITNSATQSISIVFAFKAASFSVAQYLIHQGNNAVGSGQGFAIYVDTTGIIGVQAYSGSWSDGATSTSGAITLNTPCLIGVVIDAAAHTCTFYKNGSVINTVTGYTFGTGTTGTTAFNLGKEGSGANFLNGTLQGVAVFNGTVVSSLRIASYASAAGF